MSRPDELPSRATIDIAQIVEARGLGSSAARLVLVCWLVTFFDGYDMNIIGQAAPYLAPAFHLDKLMLGNIFGAGTAGLLLGGFTFGSIADRIGRRETVILATALFGALTLALALATRYSHFIVLRFMSGIALGGAIPLTWALGTEYVASRYRATMVTLIMLGYGLGVFAAGPISVVLIPRCGLASVFIFGGASSLLAALVLIYALPESLRFLASSGRRPDLLVAAIRRLAPGREIPATARFVLSDETASSVSPRHVRVLFSGDLARITPLLWLGYIASSMTTFFLTSWGPIVFGALGFTRNAAALFSSSNSLGGMLGGLALMRFTDRTGVITLALFPLISVPLLLAAGFGSMSQTAFVALMLLLSVFLAGSHFGITSITGLFYPTACRGLGTGWASSVGKIGSTAGPIIGGIVLSSSLPTQQTFAVMAVCPAVLCVCMLAIGLLQRRARRDSAMDLARHPVSEGGAT
ncbi:MAG TPA: MFS transporter [Steroidobacteraceae bacterium]|nr:MFS transporter [Steroidobacteraceae bacterium]